RLQDQDHAEKSRRDRDDAERPDPLPVGEARDEEGEDRRREHARGHGRDRKEGETAEVDHHRRPVDRTAQRDGARTHRPEPEPEERRDTRDDCDRHDHPRGVELPEPGILGDHPDEIVGKADDHGIDEYQPRRDKRAAVPGGVGKGRHLRSVSRLLKPIKPGNHETARPLATWRDGEETMGWLADETGLEKNRANFVPLTPLSHLSRAADLFGAETAVVYGGTRRTYAEYHARVSRLASALARRGIAPGDVVATILPNIPAQAEAHFGVPAAGAILSEINTRLDADTVCYILDHGQAKVVLVDSAFLPLAEAAVKAMTGAAPEIIEVADAEAGIAASGRYPEYEDLLAQGDPGAPWHLPADEWESIALNYTSGTTGRPKGVVYHHRGAYLMTMGTVVR